MKRQFGIGKHGRWQNQLEKGFSLRTNPTPHLPHMDSISAFQTQNRARIRVGATASSQFNGLGAAPAVRDVEGELKPTILHSSHATTAWSSQPRARYSGKNLATCGGAGLHASPLVSGKASATTPCSGSGGLNLGRGSELSHSPPSLAAKKIGHRQFLICLLPGP